MFIYRAAKRASLYTREPLVCAPWKSVYFFLTSTAFVDTNAKYGIPLSRYAVFLKNCPLEGNPKSISLFHSSFPQAWLQDYLQKKRLKHEKRRKRWAFPPFLHFSTKFFTPLWKTFVAKLWKTLLNGPLVIKILVSEHFFGFLSLLRKFGRGSVYFHLTIAPKYDIMRTKIQFRRNFS